MARLVAPIREGRQTFQGFGCTEWSELVELARAYESTRQPPQQQFRSGWRARLSDAAAPAPTAVPAPEVHHKAALRQWQFVPGAAGATDRARSNDVTASEFFRAWCYAPLLSQHVSQTQTALSSSPSTGQKGYSSRGAKPKGAVSPDTASGSRPGCHRHHRMVHGGSMAAVR